LIRLRYCNIMNVMTMAGLDKIVTDELVFSIADRLTAEGRKVSNRVLWDHIGGGSMTTIAGALRRWRESARRQPGSPLERHSSWPVGRGWMSLVSRSCAGLLGMVVVVAG